MDETKLQTEGQVGEECHQKEMIELPPSELSRIGAGLCDPGIIDVDK